MQVQAVLALADDNGFAGQGNLWIRSVGEVRHEDALPNSGALGGLHVLHVKNFLGKSFIKDSRLDLKRNLRTLEAFFEMSKSGLRARRDVEAIDKRSDPRHEDKGRECAEKGPHAHAAGAHGSDLAVGGEAAETDKDSDQHAHGEGVGEGERNGEEEDFRDTGQGSAGA